jgi:hypothetical protein
MRKCPHESPEHYAVLEQLLVSGLVEELKDQNTSRRRQPGGTAGRGALGGFSAVPSSPELVYRKLGHSRQDSCARARILPEE